MTRKITPKRRVRWLQFPNLKGELLSASMEMPTHHKPRCIILFAHCFTCGKDLGAMQHISRILVERDFGVMRFDFTGLGQSEGDFADTNFSSNVEDLICAADYLREFHGQAPQVLVGHSLGGAAVIKASAKVSEVKAVITVGAPSETKHLAEILKDTHAQAQEHGEAEVTIGPTSVTLKKQFFDDALSHSMEDILSHFDKALMVMHSPYDEMVKIEHGEALFHMAQQPKSFYCLQGMDHLLKRTKDAEKVATIMADWLNPYIECSGK